MDDGDDSPVVQHLTYPDLGEVGEVRVGNEDVEEQAEGVSHS